MYVNHLLVLLQLEVYVSTTEEVKSLPLPVTKGDDTIFEYVVNDAGEWEHWEERVS